MQTVTLNNKDTKKIEYAENYEEFLDSIIKAFNLDENLRNKMIIKTEDGTVIESQDDFDDNIMGDYPHIFVTVEIPKKEIINEEETKIDNAKKENESNKNSKIDEPKQNQNIPIIDTKIIINEIEKMLTEKILDNLNQNFNQVNEENKKLGDQIKGDKKIYLKYFNNLATSITNFSSLPLFNNLQKSQELSQISDNNNNNDNNINTSNNNNNNNNLIEKLKDKNKEIEELKKNLFEKDKNINNLNSEIIDKLNFLDSKIGKNLSENSNYNNNNNNNNNDLIMEYKKKNEELETKIKELEKKKFKIRKRKSRFNN